MSTNKYMMFVDIASQVIKESRIPLYSCKFSKKTYTQHQLLILLLLKEYLGEDYRDTVELTEIMDSLRERINLDQVPHFTTIVNGSVELCKTGKIKVYSPLPKLPFSEAL